MYPKFKNTLLLNSENHYRPFEIKILLIETSHFVKSKTTERMIIFEQSKL